MKIILYILALSSILFANTADTATCQKCHPTISAEFENSMHRKSSIHHDKVHKAVWDKHPAKAKDNYKCAKCHTPSAKTKLEQHQGITCIDCHTIKNVEKHEKANKNIYTGEKKTFYSAEAGRESEKVTYKKTSTWRGTTTVGSAFHDIDYTNKNYYDGKMCMGCHSHKENSHSFDVCTTDEAGAKDTKENCITCHMPKVEGTATTVRVSKKHSFHGFPGARVESRMLSKYVGIELHKSSNGFKLTIDNKAPHDLMTHPLRVVQLKTKITRGDKHIELKTHTFVKVIGTEGKPSMPWLATEIIKDNMIKSNEKRVIEYNETLQGADKVEVTLGFYVVNPKALKKLNLDGEKEISKFTVLKMKNFTVE